MTKNDGYYESRLCSGFCKPFANADMAYRKTEYSPVGVAAPKASEPCTTTPSEVAPKEEPPVLSVVKETQHVSEISGKETVFTGLDVGQADQLEKVEENVAEHQELAHAATEEVDSVLAEGHQATQPLVILDEHTEEAVPNVEAVIDDLEIESEKADQTLAHRAEDFARRLTDEISDMKLLLGTESAKMSEEPTSPSTGVNESGANTGTSYNDMQTIEEDERFQLSLADSEVVKAGPETPAGESEEEVQEASEPQPKLENVMKPAKKGGMFQCCYASPSNETEVTLEEVLA